MILWGGSHDLGSSIRSSLFNSYVHKQKHRKTQKGTNKKGNRRVSLDDEDVWTAVSGSSVHFHADKAGETSISMCPTRDMNKT